MSQPVSQLQCEIVKTNLNRILFVSTGDKLRKQLGITGLGFFSRQKIAPSGVARSTRFWQNINGCNVQNNVRFWHFSYNSPYVRAYSFEIHLHNIILDYECSGSNSCLFYLKLYIIGLLRCTNKITSRESHY